LVEILIIGRYGLALYGLYAVGSRLYQTLMLLLQSALYDVSLTILSKISHQRERMADIYINSISLSAYVASPIFVVCAALSPEICNVLFGGKWQGVDAIARPLLLLGALQCVQFLNGPYLSARGRPDRVFFAGLAKAVATVTALLFLPSDNIAQLTLIYAVGQLAATPLTFAFTLSELGIPVVKLLEVMVPAALSNTAGFLAVHFSRSSGLNGEHMHVVLAGIMLGAVFLLTYGLIAFALAREQIMRCLAFARNRIARR
jgi:O-antigen/teichoic acid export membrane protein